MSRSWMATICVHALWLPQVCSDSTYLKPLLLRSKLNQINFHSRGARNTYRAAAVAQLTCGNTVIPCNSSMCLSPEIFSVWTQLEAEIKCNFRSTFFQTQVVHRSSGNTSQQSKFRAYIPKL